MAIGSLAGRYSQGAAAVAIGYLAGNDRQGLSSVAIGDEVGSYTQGWYAVSIGSKAGLYGQNRFAIAIGREAGGTNQSSGAVAIGYRAGFLTQGAHAIAIGYGAGQTQQPANSIVINATGAGFSPATATTNSCFITPIRSAQGTLVVQYITATGEVVLNASSRSVKNTIKDLTMATDGLYNLRPRTFLYNNDTWKVPIVGYIAEEVAEIDKEFSTYNQADGAPVGINWNLITVFLVEEMKKLKRENEDLKRSYDALAARVLALENK